VDAVVNLVPDSMIVGKVFSRSGDEQVVLQS